ncbi:hypothetical protein [Glycomyces sp. NPDC048151]|uniref:hypothetical protein n=1 Tax=Glycomyces sp. NPDC048151 TaxID=3364002 RepID=UPI003711A1AA
MADLAPAPQPVSASTSDDDNLTHTVCVCDTNLGLCGADCTESNWVEEDDNECLVCDYLDDYYTSIGTCCRIGAEHDCG